MQVQVLSCPPSSGFRQVSYRPSLMKETLCSLGVKVGLSRRQTVTGIGGFFFPTSHPKVKARWYQERPGIDLLLEDYGQRPGT